MNISHSYEYFFFACFDDLCPSQQFSLMLGQFPVFLGLTSTKQQISVVLKDTTQQVHKLATL